MGMYLDLHKQRRQAYKSLEGLFKEARHVFVIHYSCEGFYNSKDGRTPRVTSIAARSLASAQTKSFSIHKAAEQQHVVFADITEHYDRLERKMLDEFFQFVRANLHCSWLHWNMRDINYGFQGIEHRYRVLGGVPIEISDEKKVDLSRVLVAVYAEMYAAHPRLESVTVQNGLRHKDFLGGEAEALAWENRDFVKLHQSTLRKVDIMANIAGKAHAKSLSTSAPWKDRLPLHPAAAVEAMKEHWIYALIGLLVGCFGVLKLFWPYKPVG